MQKFNFKNMDGKEITIAQLCKWFGVLAFDLSSVWLFSNDTLIVLMDLTSEKALIHKELDLYCAESNTLLQTYGSVLYCLNYDTGEEKIIKRR